MLAVVGMDTAEDDLSGDADIRCQAQDLAGFWHPLTTTGHEVLIPDPQSRRFNGQAQAFLAAAKFHFRQSLVMNVGDRAHPYHDSPIFVQKGNGSRQHPAILPVRVLNTILKNARLVRGPNSLPLGEQLVAVIWMSGFQEP